MKFEKIKKIFKILRKWWLPIAVVLFFVYLMFFDQNNIRVRMEYKNELDSLKEVLDSYIKQMQEDSIKIEQLKHDKDAIEEYAREEYGYKKADEDVFIIKSSAGE
ncbi:MAG: septum formation initiator family protein [Bacteroidales bacterium]|nr:septum formation initiator family protein [Bacteroidales bacterium]